ncbi:hypothetical protein F5877DRAFT_82131 [Lentinula edodes]|nr:hypothetical protein F5877DRAFT_82131 [Lentinula edodes]
MSVPPPLSPLRPLAGDGDHARLTVNCSRRSRLPASPHLPRSIDILYHRPINFFKNPKPDYPWITLHGIGEHGHASAQHRTKSRGTEPLSPIVMVVGRLRDFRARRSTLGGISCGKESNDPVTDFGLEIQGRILGFLLFTSLHHIHYAEVLVFVEESKKGREERRGFVSSQLHSGSGIVPLRALIEKFYSTFRWIRKVDCNR